MFSRWLKRSNRLDHPDAAKRLAAIEALTAEDAAARQSELKRIVQTDDDNAVVNAAIDLLTDEAICAELLDHDPVSDRVAARIAALVTAGATSTRASDERVMAERIQHATPDQLAALLADVTTAEQCASLALKMRDAQRNQVLEHELLRTEDGLSQLLKLTKGRDKYCHRHAREQLEAIKQARGGCSDHSTRLLEIDQAISKTIATEQDRYARIQKLLKLRDMRADVEQSLAAERNKLAAAGGSADEFPLPANPLEGMRLELPSPAEDPFPALVEEIKTLATAMRNGISIEEIRTTRERITGSWLSLADRHPPSPAQHQAFEAVSAQFQAYQQAWRQLQAVDTATLLESSASLRGDASLKAVQQWLKRWRKTIANLSWPEDHELPPALVSAREQLAEIEARSSKLDAARADTEKALAGHVERARQAVEAGHVREAAQALKQARALQKRGFHSHDRDLGSLSARLDEFRDWQQFATNPKREALLSEITELAENPLEPATQAERLKALRTRWLQLGRPANAEEAAQQEHFDSMAEKAFEPCRAFYDEQANARAANLEQRKALCDQLEAYLESTNWEDADLRAAETIMRTAREEWRKHHPCERKALKPVESRFEALQETLHGKLKDNWNANLNAKEAIVAAARQLLDEPLDSQIDGAKRLQQDWRNVGPTPRGPDQKLWREFRGLCDQIFAGRDAARVEAQAAYDAGRQALDDALTSLEALLADDASATPAAWRSARAAYDEQARHSRPSGQHRKRLEQAESAWRAHLQAKKRQDVLVELKQWSDWDTAVSAAERDQTPLESPHKWFTARLTGDGEPLDWLRLTIEAEIAADMPSAAADQSRRMEIQVEMMNSGTRPQDVDYKVHLKQWCEAGPKDDVAEELRDRFFAALASRINAS